MKNVERKGRISKKEQLCLQSEVKSNTCMSVCKGGVLFWTALFVSYVSAWSRFILLPFR